MLFTLSACRCLHSTLSCSSLTYSPGLHISTADPDSKGQLMAEQTISITLNGEAKEVAADQTGVQLFAEDKNIIAVRLNGEPRTCIPNCTTATSWNRLHWTAKMAWPSCVTPQPTLWHRPCRRSVLMPSSASARSSKTVSITISCRDSVHS